MAIREVTVDYDMTTSQPKSRFKVADIDVSDYPPKGQGPVTGRLPNASLLGPLVSGAQLTQMFASLAAEGADAETKRTIEKFITPIQAHFKEALEAARKEFLAKFPNAGSVRQASGVDRHRVAYDAAAAKLRVPENAKVAAAILIAMAKEKDREEAFRIFGPKLERAGIRPADLKAFQDVGTVYETKLVDLRERLEKLEAPLPAMAADIGRRAAVLQRAGQHLAEAFWGVINSPLGLFYVVYYQAMRIHYLSTVFQGLGDRMAAFAEEVRSLVGGYERMEEELDEELIRVGNQLNDFQVPSPRPRGPAR
jgi:hypothetical protein